MGMKIGSPEAPKRQLKWLVLSRRKGGANEQFCRTTSWFGREKGDFFRFFFSGRF